MVNAARDDFGGAGGAHLGLTAAGYDVTSYDNWTVAINSQRLNGHRAELLDLSVEDPPAPAGPWLLWASPPCTPFSLAGSQQGPADPRNGIPWWLRIVRRQRPDVTIMENVRALAYNKHAAYFATILGTLHVLGYWCEWRVLNAADYGIPQTRERLFIVARRDGAPVVWPTVTHTEEPGLFTDRWVSMADALGWDGYVATMRGAGMSERHGTRPPRSTDRPAPTVRTRGGTLDRGGFSRYALNTGRDWKPGGDRTTAQTITLDRAAPTVATTSDRWWLYRPATTINGDRRVSAPGHHDPDVSGSQQADAIPVTLSELARLQDFPDGYLFSGTGGDRAVQIGNAVPPTLVRLLTDANRPAPW